jgi:hypothetical protein
MVYICLAPFISLCLITFAKSVCYKTLHVIFAIPFLVPINLVTELS